MNFLKHCAWPRNWALTRLILIKGTRGGGGPARVYTPLFLDFLTNSFSELGNFSGQFSAFSDFGTLLIQAFDHKKMYSYQIKHKDKLRQHLPPFLSQALINLYIYEVYFYFWCNFYLLPGCSRKFCISLKCLRWHDLWFLFVFIKRLLCDERNILLPNFW